ncbi:PREDICTED: monoacylglycerol lipase ABHD12-like [Cyprinodon variegatus]|uniref:monoacylglycerol lipase ABHD12-like n=1 Tax=Cyprinodon variegatus TaxID=28743 RepID=UPI0007429EE3|nr:PREDICTED: monoacylglycerol lipase ABHD12-like [Cyprinodon variegatus]
MKRRTVKPADSSPERKDRKAASSLKQQGSQSGRRLKKGLLIAVAVCILVPVVYKVIPDFIQAVIYTYRLHVPFFVDLGRPADLSLNHTINMYLTSEEGISLGVWHTVPESRWKEAQGKDLIWYQNTLNDGNPVFLYMHGNTGWSKTPSSLGAVFLCRVISNTAVKLLEQGIVFDGVILEGAFNSERQYMPFYVFGWYYMTFPGIKNLFRFLWEQKKVVFPTEQNLKKMKSPILFLHSEDDHLVPIEVARRTYEVAAKAQGKDRVKLVTFDGSLGYLHNGLYRDPKLPGVLKEFVNSL